MSKQSFLGFIIVFVLIIFVISIYYNFSVKDELEPSLDENVLVVTPSVTDQPKVTDDPNKSGDSGDDDVNTTTYTYTNEFGSGDKTITINAIQAEQLSGFSGASNHVFYIDGNYDLYYLELTNLVKTKLSSNVNDIEVEDGKVTAHFKHPHDVYEENSFVTYKELS